MVNTAFARQISWKGYDFLTNLKHLEHLLNRIPSLATTKMIKCVDLAQEKVYYSLAVNFLTSDYFASCTEMNILGNSILCLLILSSKTVKTVKTRLLT